MIMVVGNYGSGKTEVAVNLALALAAEGLKLDIADLDVVNPYFRCREAREIMERHGIRVVGPPPGQTWADLPIVVPEIKGMLAPPKGRMSIFDVGGDDVGARLVSSLVPALGDNPYELWQVINARRPFTETVDGCLDMLDKIEAASRLRVTGLIANTHLMNETTPEIILEGYRLASKVAKQAAIPIVCVTAMGEMADAPELATVKEPLFRLARRMLPPWIRPQDEAGKKNTPEGRAVPIGRP
ncbi:MAG TPA: cobalamin biosynthesis protein CbiA [Myxococcota bacterium]|nr:cobalamin biosynthesis protein CbiA [Myxococcota bacterium]